MRAYDIKKFRVLSFALIAGPALCIICRCNLGGSDDPPPPPVLERPANTPPVPVPTFAGESLPGTSDKLVFQENDITVFQANLDNVPLSIQDDYPGATVTYDPHPQPKLMINNGVIVNPVSLTIHTQYPGFPIPKTTVDGPPLSTRPTIQWVRFWKLLVSSVVPYPTSFQQSVTYTNGTSETTGQSFSFSVGASASGWGIGLSAELTKTFSKEVTVSSEKSVTQTFTCDSESGFKIQFAIWQLVDEFRICNSGAAGTVLPLFTDANYDFTNFLCIDNDTTLLYMSVTKFPE